MKKPLLQQNSLRNLQHNVVLLTILGLSTIASVAGSAAWSETRVMPSDLGPLAVTQMVDGLDVPWGFGFLPDGGVLVTERSGTLWYAKGTRKTRITGLPPVEVDGQGGLLDVLIPRDFAKTREIFLTFSIRQGRGAGAAVARAKLDRRKRSLSDVEVIFEATPHSSGGRHFGSRLAESHDGTLFVTLGERGDRPSAQDLRVEQGSIVRINRDGSIPADNPFAKETEIRPAIWSFGHRNPQGLAVDQNGTLWAVEHGARGGDEINRIRKGANFGWPVISYGRHYSGLKIGEGNEKPGMEQPSWYWDPSIAPSGMMIYSGKLWPEWRGDIFVGSLKFDYISRLERAPLREVEQISADITERIRDIREAPDGSIWFASEGAGALFRITPGEQ